MIGWWFVFRADLKLEHITNFDVTLPGKPWLADDGKFGIKQRLDCRTLGGSLQKMHLGYPCFFLVWIEKPQEFHNAEHEICGSGQNVRPWGLDWLVMFRINQEFWFTGCVHTNTIGTSGWGRRLSALDDGWIHSWRCVKHNVQAQYHVKPNIMWYHVYVIVYIYMYR
jgi:hypothetical protein